MACTSTRLLAVVLLLLACSDDATTGSTGADADEKPAVAADSGTSGPDATDTADPDSGPGDSLSGNDEGIEPPDEGAPPTDATACTYVCALDCVCKKDAAGCDLPVCEESGCPEVAGALEAAIGDLQGCGSFDDCALFEYPICGSAGCFQRAINADADLTPLWALGQHAQELQCEGFHCGCGYGSTPICLAGTCTLCPGPDCTATCEELLQAIKSAAAFAASPCDQAADCQLLDSPICSEAGLGCYSLAISIFTPIQYDLQALLDLYGEQGCPTADCDCMDDVVSCVDGVCVASEG